MIQSHVGPDGLLREDPPERPGFRFTGWSGDGEPVYVEWTLPPVRPAPPERVGFRFTGGWSGDGEPVYEPWPPPWVIRRDTPLNQLSAADLFTVVSEDNGPDDAEYYLAMEEVKVRLMQLERAQWLSRMKHADG